MSVKEGVNRSILIVSSSERFDSLVKRSLRGFVTIDIKRSVAIARRSILERDYDLIVINCPMPDEMGVEFALDAADRTGALILVVVPSEIYDEVLEEVTDYCILAISKPIPQGRIDKAVRYMLSVQSRLDKLRDRNRKLENKLEEQRLVGKAKSLLMKEKGMTEDEAHSYIGREAMNNGVSRRIIAERIIEDFSY